MNLGLPLELGMASPSRVAWGGTDIGPLLMVVKAGHCPICTQSVIWQLQQIAVKCLGKGCLFGIQGAQGRQLTKSQDDVRRMVGVKVGNECMVGKENSSM